MENTFGNILADLRKKKKLTQAQLAEQVSVTPQAVSRWENNETNPDFDMLIKLAEIFGITVDYLLTGIAKEPEKASNIVCEEPKNEQKKTYIPKYAEPVRPQTVPVYFQATRQIINFDAKEVCASKLSDLNKKKIRGFIIGAIVFIASGLLFLPVTIGAAIESTDTFDLVWYCLMSFFPFGLFFHVAAMVFQLDYVIKDGMICELKGRGIISGLLYFLIGAILFLFTVFLFISDQHKLNKEIKWFKTQFSKLI